MHAVGSWGLCSIVSYTKLADLHAVQEKGKSKKKSIANYRNWAFFVQGQHIPHFTEFT